MKNSNNWKKQKQQIQIQIQDNNHPNQHHHHSNSATSNQKQLQQPQLTTDGILFYNSLLSSLPALIWWLGVAGGVGCGATIQGVGRSLGFLFWFCGEHVPRLHPQLHLFPLHQVQLGAHVDCCRQRQNCISSYVGMLLGDYHYSNLNFLGVNVSLFAAIMYAYGELSRQSKPPSS